MFRTSQTAAQPELFVSETDILDINQAEEQDTLSINIIIVNFLNLLYIIVMLNKYQYICKWYIPEK